jgi:hypothetical protein
MTNIEIWNDIVLTSTSLATAFMIWKTKTLTDVVKELKNQTTILADRLNLELNLSNPKRYPIFIIEQFQNVDQYGSILDLRNIGQYATNFYLQDVQGDIMVKGDGLYYDQTQENLNYKLRIHLTCTSGLGIHKFSFTLFYKDGYGNLFSQFIDYTSPNVKIHPAKLIS